MQNSSNKNKTQATRVKRLAPAIEALAALGIVASPDGRSWNRMVQGLCELGETGEQAQVRLALVGIGKVPSVNPSDAAEAQKVLDWFDKAGTREEAIEQAASLYKRVMEKAHKDSKEEAGRLGRRLRRTLQEGLSLPDLAESFDIAYAQWSSNWRIKRQAGELEEKLSLDAYPTLFPMARNMGRSIEIFTGPTNSGKTYAGMQLLASAKSGAYLAPLRLLAMEGQEAISERGLLCSLVTGEERSIDPNARFVASTVEMADFNTEIEVAVIDEAQMLADKDRGWAWTAAIFGMPAKKLAIVCAPEAVEMVKKLLSRAGESCVVHRFERKTPLEAMAKPVDLGDIRDGDALIAFSRKNALMWRDKAASLGKTVAVIYGALAPEVRRHEAQRFASGQAQILVATDAIGMGLNLPIKRVIFTTASKFDGQETRELGTQELRQIAGRAGRYGVAERGYAGAIEAHDASLVIQALSDGVEQLSDRASIAPNDRQIEQMSRVMNIDKLGPMLCFFRDHLVKSDELFKASGMEDMIELAWKADQRSKLDLSTRFAYAKTPVDRADLDHVRIWESWMRDHEMGRKTKAPTEVLEPRSPRAEDKLWECERAMKLLSAYCWLSWRFEDVFTQREAAEAARAQISKKIEAMLSKMGSTMATKNPAKKNARNHGTRQRWK